MPDYSKGKIYKITGGGLTYIGSTTVSLAQRMAQHRSDKKRWENGNKKCSVTSAKVLQYEDNAITLIEDVVCDRKEQLLARERYWIEQIKNVNKIIPTRSSEEYVQKRKEERKIHRQELYIKNIDAKKERKKERQKLYRQTDKCKEYRKYYRDLNKDKINEKKREMRRLDKIQNS